MERRDDGPDLLTGIIIGAALAGSSGGSAEARPSESFEGRGGEYGGGGASGSWSDSNSSSSSDSSVSYSSDSGGGGGGGD